MANISETAKNLVTGMLTKDPAQRLSIDQVLAHEWLNWGAPNQINGALNSAQLHIYNFLRHLKHIQTAF